MAGVKFFYGNEADYMAMSAKDDNTLYFLTDTCRLFKGADEFTKSLRLVNSLPSTSDAAQGVLYILASDYSTYIFSGGIFQQIYKGYATQIPDSGATDNTVPQTKAVADFINEKFQTVTQIKEQYVQDVTYDAGNLTVVENGQPYTTQLVGVAHGVMYDRVRQILRVPMYGGEALEVNFTQLSTIKSGSYNPETGNIDLILANDEVVSIPVAQMIDIYTGAPTQTTTTTVDSAKHITVKVKISETADNAIRLENDGLYAYIPDGYTKSEVDGRIKAVTDALQDHIDDTVKHVTNAERATWNSKVSTTQLAIAKQEAITAAEADATNKANAALVEAKGYTDSQTGSLNSRLTAVEAAIEWQTLED